MHTAYSTGKQAITTTYKGPTNFKPARIIAQSASGIRLTCSIDQEKNIDHSHAIACEALMQKLGWQGEMLGGSTKSSMVWVFLDKIPARSSC